MSTAFRIQMTGAQETPPNASTASGLGVVIYDSAADTATYEVTVTGLDFGAVLGGPAQTANPNDDVTQLHVHSEVPGQPGPVVFGQIGPAEDTTGVAFSAVINADGSTTFQGRWEPSDPSSSGIETFSAFLAASNPGDAEDLYFNVHTSGFSAGEIRGQWICIADDAANNVAGTGGDDILPGLGGNDTVNGFGGDDDLTGGDLRDRLTGGNGSDTIDGGIGQGLPARRRRPGFPQGRRRQGQVRLREHHRLLAGRPRPDLRLQPGRRRDDRHQRPSTPTSGPAATRPS